MKIRRILAKPQSNETLENVAVYACETNSSCLNGTSGCGGTGSDCPCPNTYICGGSCSGEVNITYCGFGCSSS